MLARRFLYAIAIVVALVLAIALVWNLAQDRLLRMAFVPSAEFVPPAEAGATDYREPAAWLARPDLRDDPARWLPPGVTAGRGVKPAAVFYIAPTTYLSRERWNAPLDDADANGRLVLFARSQASAFNGVGEVWAPRYRQATLGAFLAAGDARSQAAIGAAYRDVVRAFDVFVAQAGNRPIILVAHSQGSLHLLRLLRERVAGRPLAARIVAAYAVGWPISVTTDLPVLGLPACARADQAGCILSWQSFAEPAEPRLIDAYFAATKGYTGAARAGTPMLCVDPVTGTQNGRSATAANLGTLVPQAGLAGADLVAGHVPAACTPGGLLSIGSPPEGFAAYVLPGNNYHVFDYALFWANIRADAARRVAAFARR